MKKQGSLITTIVVAALAVAMIFGVNQFLKAEEAKTATVSEYASVYPSGQEFQPAELEIAENEQDEFVQVLEVLENGSQVGYVIDKAEEGYGGEFVYRIGVSNDGIVQGFEVLEHNETPGFGAAMETPEFAQGLVGANLATGSITHGEGDLENGQIHGISGATVTTNAITESLVDIANALSTAQDAISPVLREVPYYAEKWQELFKNDISIFKFEELVDEEFYQEGISRIIRVKDQEDNIDSYLVQAIAKGYAGDIDYILRLDENYRVFNIAFGSQNETPDLGGYIDDPAYKDLIKGINLDKNLLTKAIKLRKTPTQEKDILLISGATVTSNAMKESLDSVIEDLVRFDSIKNDDGKYVPLVIEDIQAEGAEVPSFDHTVFEGVDESQASDKATNDLVVAASTALGGGSELGTIYDVVSEGFAGNIEFGVLVDDAGVIKDFVVYNHGETEGYGAEIETDSYKGKVVGLNLADITDDASVDAISGATFTTDAIHNGLKAVKEAAGL